MWTMNFKNWLCNLFFVARSLEKDSNVTLNNKPRINKESGYEKV